VVSSAANPAENHSISDVTLNILTADGYVVSDGGVVMTEDELAAVEDDPFGGRYHVLQTATGLEYTLAIRSDGTLWSWGLNDNGQLGLGDTDYRHVPTMVPFPDGVSAWRYVSASAGASQTQDGMYQMGQSGGFAMAIDQDGQLWTWGNGQDGRLGLGAGSLSAVNSTPQMVTAPAVTPAVEWASVAGGSNHALGLDTEGRLWSWGGSIEGKLGLGNVALAQYNVPQRVANPTGAGAYWTAVSAGVNHTVAIDSNGFMYGWGANGSGQLGIGNYGANNRTPERIAGPPQSWVAVSAGANHTLAIDAVGNLYGVGLNTSGQLGQGTMSTGTSSLVRITNVPGVTDVPGTPTWAAVSANGNHSAALTTDGRLFKWGANSYGQHGLGDTDLRNRPVQVIAAGVDAWTEVDAGYTHTAAKDSDGRLWTWGDNRQGELGKGIITPNPATPGAGTNNWLPWMVTASVAATSDNDKTPAPDAVSPQHGAEDVLVGDDLSVDLVVRFDRPMQTGVDVRGEISFTGYSEANRGGDPVTVDVTLDWDNAVWSQGDTVLTIPMNLGTEMTWHFVTVSGFLDAFLGSKDYVEMTPFSWEFKTGLLDENVFTGDTITYDASTCATCHFTESLRKEHAFVTSRGITDFNYDYGCQKCHGVEFETAPDSGKINWLAHPELKEELRDCDPETSGCLACHGGPDAEVHRGPTRMLQAHTVDAGLIIADGRDNGCSGSGCHGAPTYNPDEQRWEGFGFGSMDLASAHADYWDAVQRGAIRETSNPSVDMTAENPSACGVCHSRADGQDHRLRTPILNHINAAKAAGQEITCTTCHKAPASMVEAMSGHNIVRDLDPDLARALGRDVAPAPSALSAAQLFTALSSQTRAELNLGSSYGNERLVPSVLAPLEAAIKESR